ncbi:MAG: hypothetical protein JWO10_586 [Microbacteriaceae bacterium]|nr:hypothetical protein [Microbacteriaceae bacterium]
MSDTTKVTTGPALVAPLLLGRYQPIALLARGGAASVYRGQDRVLGRDVAIKVFSAGSELDLDQYRAEVRVLASLSHHGIVSIVDAGIDESSPEDPRPFLVMELVRGGTMADAIAGKGLAERRIGEIGFEVAEALEYVHASGVIHRDITPSNIMLVDYGTVSSRPRARLTDFGIAIDTAATPANGLATAGTAAYISPEQAGARALSTASDIYSLGLVLLESFTGVRAFAGDAVTTVALRLSSEPEIPHSVPRAWRPLLRRMLERDPEKRPSAAEAAESIRAALRATSKN